MEIKVEVLTFAKYGDVQGESISDDDIEDERRGADV